MSLATWKKEFYPCNANSKKAKANPIAHSLKKWQGLLPSNLKKHGLTKSGYTISDDKANSLGISDESCALCALYIEDGCTDCPLYLARNGVRCDDTKPKEETAPFFAFIEDNDPKPMIALLKKVLG